MCINMWVLGQTTLRRPQRGLCLHAKPNPGSKNDPALTLQTSLARGVVRDSTWSVAKGYILLLPALI